MTHALLDVGAGGVFDFLHAGARCVAVHVGAVTSLAAEQCVDGHIGPLSLDVPQRLIDAAHGVVQHRPVAPVRADVHRLPDVLDVVRVLALQERAEELVDSRDNRLGALGERCAAVPVEAGLARLHLDDYRAGQPRGRRKNRLDVGDLQIGQAP